MRLHSKTTAVVALLAVSGVLSGCGHTTGDRALTGGAIGAGAGAVGGSLLGADPLTSAIVGGAAGAATGALTSERNVNLGRPVWRR